jgi:hypothetical protein
MKYYLPGMALFNAGNAVIAENGFPVNDSSFSALSAIAALTAL